MAEFDRAAAEAALTRYENDNGTFTYYGPAGEILDEHHRHLRAALADLDRERARKLPTYTADLELTLEVIAEALGGTTGPAGITHRAAELVAERDRLAAENARLREALAGLVAAAGPFAEVRLPDNWPDGCQVTWDHDQRATWANYLPLSAPPGAPTVADYRRLTAAARDAGAELEEKP